MNSNGPPENNSHSEATMGWSTEAAAALQEGRAAQVRPRGHSMVGRISDGDLVTLTLCNAEELTVGDIVLVRIQGKRFSHAVLHGLLSVEGERFLICSHQGCVDGWVDRGDIYGIVTEIKAQP